jgi:hypothetical protein
MGQLCQLGDKLENAVQQIEELKRKNKELEEQLRGTVAECEFSRHAAVRREHKGAES